MSSRSIFSVFLLGLALTVQARAEFLLPHMDAEAAFPLRLYRYGRIHNGGLGSQRDLKVDLRDAQVNSPKSVRFSEDGRKIYINSLEGGQTLVYSWPDLQKLKTIDHKFDSSNDHLFHNEKTVFNNPYFQSNFPDGNPNHFTGKPVESELSHRGRWLWIPYYRRSFDDYGQSPSAVAIVDTQRDEIVRVMPTGPIPKYVAASPDGRWVAITHWGDNTIGLIDTSSGNPDKFRYVAQFVVEQKLSQADKAHTDRDRTCGFCLRGTVFTPDSRTLIVARMGQGGIAGFDVQSGRYLGTLMNIASTPRHLVLSPDGQTLFASSNVAGVLSRLPVQDVVQALEAARGQRSPGPKWQEVTVGSGARTVHISDDGLMLYVAVNQSSELVAVDAQQFKVKARLKIDPYAVGLAVSPDGGSVLLTSQGHNGRGGNAVNLIRVESPLVARQKSKTGESY